MSDSPASLRSRSLSHSLSSHGPTPVEVKAVKIGSHYSYKIPSVCAITVELRHVVLQDWNDRVGEYRLVDAFLQDDPLLPQQDVPAVAMILKACNVPVSEFMMASQ